MHKNSKLIGNALSSTTRLARSGRHTELYLILERSQKLYACRKQERPLNACMFTKLVRSRVRFRRCGIDSFFSQGLTKVIPGSPEGQTPVHELTKPIMKPIQK